LLIKTNQLAADLILAEYDDVTDDDIDGVAQTCVTIQLGDLASHKHRQLAYSHEITAYFSDKMSATVQVSIA